MAIGEVLRALGDRARPNGQDRWMSKCPAHDDRMASLSMSLGQDGRVLLKCHAGCNVEAIVSAAGLEMEDLFAEKETATESLPPSQWPVTAEYVYRDEAGEALYRALRKTSPDSGKKTFVQQAADGWGGWKGGAGCMDGVRRVPYRLPELLATKEGDTVFVVEGEKDVENLAKVGIVATTNAGGAGKWDKGWAPIFTGRRVVVIPDNDEPGEKHAEDVRSSIGGATRILRLPGLLKKGDVSDWLAAGGTKERLLALAAQSAPAGFQASPERLAGEREERLAEGRRLLTYGVRFLDDATMGIAPHDLVLIGAKTGVGKTALATTCALANARAGKRVFFFALEADRREIERRMKWTFISDLYYANADRFGRRAIRYLEWRRGLLDMVVGRYEDEADALARKAMRNLLTFYRENSFAASDFGKHVEQVRDEADLFVLDHFHYLDSSDEQQNRAAESAAKIIRDTCLMAGVPGILVAHTRKADKRTEGIVPTIDDYMGSSHLSKVVTAAIMMAPAHSRPTEDKRVWSTFIHVAKLRDDSTVNRYVACIGYDTRTNGYLPGYEVGKLGLAGEFIEIPPADYPDWATGAVNSEARDSFESAKLTTGEFNEP